MKNLEEKHPLAIRWFHWVNFPVLMVMIWSGLLIYWANDVYRIGIGQHTLIHFFPESFYKRFNLSQRLAEGMAWHFLFMWVFAVNGAVYVLYTAFSGEWRYLLPARETLREAWQVVLHDLHIRKQTLPRRKFNGAQRIAYTSVIAMGFGSLLTGLAIYKPIQLAWVSSPLGRLAGTTGSNATGYEVARFLHFWFTIAFTLFFLVHVIQVMRAGWNNFRSMITGYEVVETVDNPALLAHEFEKDKSTPTTGIVDDTDGELISVKQEQPDATETPPDFIAPQKADVPTGEEDNQEFKGNAPPP